MIVLNAYWLSVFNNLAMVGNCMALVYSFRNAWICIRQLRRSKKIIHIINLGQVITMIILWSLTSSQYIFQVVIDGLFPYGASLWHIIYILMEIIMLLRCLIVVKDPAHARVVKIVGCILLFFRVADWPYELATYYISLWPAIGPGVVVWEPGVLYLGFITETLSNLLFGGLFIFRLQKHNEEYRWINKPDNRVEKLSQRSLICFIVGNLANVIMNLLKITSYVGAASNDLTPYFNIIESTMIVEALCGEYSDPATQVTSSCQNCSFQMKAKDISVGALEHPDESLSVDIPGDARSSVAELTQPGPKEDGSEYV